MKADSQRQYEIAVQGEKENEDDPGNAAEIYEAGMANNFQTIKWRIKVGIRTEGGAESQSLVYAPNYTWVNS